MEKCLAVLAVMLLLFLLIDCNKPSSVVTIPVSPDLLAGFSYKPGSDWVYRDSITGVFASFYVSQYDFAKSNPSSGSNYITDVNSIFIQQSNPSISSSESLWIITLMQNQMYITYRNIDYLFTLFNYPYILNTNQNGYSDSVLFLTHSSYILNGNNYQNIEEIHHSYTNIGTTFGNSFTHHDIFYLNNIVGIAKMRLDHPFDTSLWVWELVRYNVVK